VLSVVREQAGRVVQGWLESMKANGGPSGGSGCRGPVCRALISMAFGRRGGKADKGGSGDGGRGGRGGCRGESCEERQGHGHGGRKGSDKGDASPTSSRPGVPSRGKLPGRGGPKLVLHRVRNPEPQKPEPLEPRSSPGWLSWKQVLNCTGRSRGGHRRGRSQ